MLSAVLLSLTLQAGEVVVVRRIETSAERTADVRTRVWEALKRDGVDVRPLRTVESEGCVVKACLTKLSRELEADWLVLVDLGHVGDEMVVRLELVVGAHLDRATSSVFTLKTAAYPGGFAEPLATFTKAVAVRLAPDAPLKAKEPEVALTPEAPAQTPAMKARVFTTGLSAAGVAFTVVAAVNAALANGRIEGAKFDAMGVPASRLTRAEAELFARDANGWLTATLISGLATAALTALTIWLWTQ